MILTISLLCSGRDKSTEDCLRSIRKVADAIGDSEIIVIDTGCNNQVKAILQQYADQIIPFSWCDDFSAARNIGIDAASGKWFMFIDDDEWFIDPTPIINFFKSGTYKAYTRATYKVRNYKDLQGKDYSDSLASRIFKLGDKKNHRFLGRVHEYYAALPGPEFHIDCHAEHYGYAFISEKDRKKHSLRNIPLILKMIEEDSDNIKWPQQLVAEYYGLKEYSKLIEFSQKTLQSIASKNDNITNIVRPLFYCCTIEGFIHTYDYLRAIDFCHQALQDSRNSDMAKARILEYEIKLHWKQTQNYTRMFEITSEFLQIYKSSNIINATNDNPIFLIDEAYQATYTNELFIYGAIASIELSVFSKTQDFISELRWIDNPPVTFSLSYLDIITVIGNHDYNCELTCIINELLSEDLTRDIIIKHMMDLCDNNQNVQNIFAQYSYDMNSNHYYINYLRLVDNINKHTLTNALDLLIKYLNSTSDFLSNNVLWNEVERCNIDKIALLSSVAPRQFNLVVDNFVANNTFQSIESVRNRFNSCFNLTSDTDNRFEYLDLKLQEGLLHKKPRNEWISEETYTTAYEHWANCCVEYYSHYLTEASLNSSCPLLSSTIKEAFLYLNE